MFIRSFYGLFGQIAYPLLCLNCKTNLYSQEKIICTSCEAQLPLTNLHQIENNSVHRIFDGKVPINMATSLFYFRKKGLGQKIIHRLKYKGEKEVGLYFGKLLGHQLLESNFFNQCGCIIPVPLHASKISLRGFNQSEVIAEGIAEILQIPVITQSIVRTKNTSTQTKKARYERWENIDNVFAYVETTETIKEPILVVDDVITTGSTVAELVLLLHNKGYKNIVVASLGVAI